MEQLTLKDIAIINMGQSPDSKTYNEERKGIPFYQGKSDFGKINPIPRVWCSEPIKIAEKNDILISVRAPIGDTNITTEKCCIGRGLASVRPINESINSKYLYYLINSKYNELNRFGTGSTFKAITKDNLCNLKCGVIPEIKEQIVIVNKLDSTSQIIERKKEQLENLNTIIKSQFVEMFGDPILNTKEWKSKKWNDVLTIKNGKNQKKVEQEDGQYPIYGSGGIMSYANDYICNEDSVIIGRKGNINNPILVRTKFWNVDTAFGLEPKKDEIIVEYLYFFCEFYNFEKHNKAVTIPSLTKADLLNIDMPVPPIDLQKQFAEFVKQIDKQKFEIENSLKEMQDLYESLMNKYFG